MHRLEPNLTRYPKNKNPNALNVNLIYISIWVIATKKSSMLAKSQQEEMHFGANRG